MELELNKNSDIKSHIQAERGVTVLLKFPQEVRETHHFIKKAVLINLFGAFGNSLGWWLV